LYGAFELRQNFIKNQVDLERFICNVRKNPSKIEPHSYVIEEYGSDDIIFTEEVDMKRESGDVKEHEYANMSEIENDDDNIIVDDGNEGSDELFEEVEYLQDDENAEVFKYEQKDDDDDGVFEVPFEFEIETKKPKKGVYNPKPFKCTICNTNIAQFHSDKTLENHYFHNHRDVMTPEETARIQRRMKEDRMRVCPLCGKVTDELNNHIKRDHKKIKNFFCDLCDYKTYKKSNIVSHVLKHRTKPERNIFCSICGIGFLRITSLTTHMRNSHSNDIYACSVCNKEFKNRDSVNKHMKMMHIRDEENFIKCPDCDKLVHKYHYKKHAQIMPGERDLQFNCDRCDKSFRNKRCYVYHRQTHTLNESSLVCSMNNCGKVFATLQSLTLHQKVHSDVKDFKCPFADCDKQYVKSQGLKTHIQLVHHLSKRRCPVSAECEYESAKHLGLRNHIVSVHSNLPEETLKMYLTEISKWNLVK
jgi:uncharacterized C2H2 Zn-finger protein